MFYRVGGYRANFLGAQATPPTKNGALRWVFNVAA